MAEQRRSYHDLEPEGSIHIPHAGKFATAAARIAATGWVSGQTFASTDVNKLAFQEKDGTYWRLLTTGPTWQKVCGGEETIADVDIYVDNTNGDDDTGTGTEANPYKTLAGAYEMEGLFGRKIVHKVNILIANAAYTSDDDWPDEIYNDVDILRGGQFTIQASGAIPTAESGPHTVQTWTDLHTWEVGHKVTVAAPGWSIDEFYGMFVHVLTGSAAGSVWALFSNDTTSLDTGYIESGWRMSATDTFEIVDCPVTFSLEKDIKITINQRKQTPWPQYATGADGDPAGFGIYGVAVDTTGYIGFSGNAFVMASKYSRFSSHHAEMTWGTVDIGGILSDETQLVKTYYENGFYPGAHINRETSPGNNRVIENSKDLYLSNINLRGFVAIVDGGRFLASMIGTQQIESYGGYVQADWVYFGSGTKDAIVSKDSTINLTYSYVKTTSADMMESYRSSVYLEGIEGDTISGYGIRVKGISQIQLGDTPVSGVTGDVFWDFDDSTDTYPTSGNVVTDSAGSFVAQY